jgi:predicted NAD/FAD-binding protein
MLNPFNMIPLHTVCRAVGITQDWWDIVFTPHYTASFLSDKLDNMCAVTAPLIEVNIPLNPTPENSADRVLTTCETWADAGNGIRDVFAKLTKDATVHTSTRVLDVKMNDDGTKTVYDEHGRSTVVDKVVFACQCTAIGNMHKSHNWIEETMLAVPEYADDWHPGTGHMHAVVHQDDTLIPEEFRADVLENGSNYVEITRNSDGDLNIENTYNFAVQSPGIKWFQDIPADQRPPLLISHALTEGKVVAPDKIVGVGNHSRAHPLYSPWNIMTMLSLRLAQGRQGVYYCANWTTPGNTHDMSLLSGIVAAHAIGAEYPFAGTDAEKDFFRLRTLMGM